MRNQPSSTTRATRRCHVLVLLGYGLSPSTWRHRFESGLAWDETPYGYGQAEEYYELTWAADHPESLLGKTFRRAVQRVLGFDWVHVWRNRHALFNCDVVWTHTEREHLAVAAVKLLYPHRAHFKSLAQTVWMWDEWPSYGRARKALVRNLIRRHDVEALHSRLNLARSRFEVPGRVVLLLPFGTASVPAPQRATPQAKPPLIVAAGNDRDRDWESLARAAAEVPEARFRVYSSSRGAATCTWPPQRAAAARRLSSRHGCRLLRGFGGGDSIAAQSPCLGKHCRQRSDERRCAGCHQRCRWRG